MDTEEKKIILLLRAVLFHYQGLGDKGEVLLRRKAKEIQAEEELKWVLASVEKSPSSSRSCKQLQKLARGLSSEHLLTHLYESWEEGMKKGYLSNSEALWILKVAKVWGIEKDLLVRIDT